MDEKELPHESLDTFKQNYVSSAAKPRGSEGFAGRENDAAQAVQGGLVSSLRGDWAGRVGSGGSAPAPAPASSSSGFVGRENDAAAVVHGKKSWDAGASVAADSPKRDSFAGRENDAAQAVKPGNIKDRLSLWGQKVEESKAAPAAGWSGRENDAAQAISGGVKDRATTWGAHAPSSAGGEDGQWKGRENDASSVVPKRS
eukprot:m.78415 g.78415  ORF g.78415 m.78415 type:complete len:200 (-) comp14747_c2_seq2:685-1284(-)